MRRLRFSGLLIWLGVLALFRPHQVAAMIVSLGDEVMDMHRRRALVRGDDPDGAVQDMRAYGRGEAE